MTETDAPESGYVVEQGHRLSDSMLWQFQRDLYNQQGIEAWSAGVVPQSITTSPYIARQYAKIVVGFLRDIADRLDRSQPVYILELGAGSGRFGCRFVKRLKRQLDRGTFRDVRFTYIMTDVSPSMIDYWRAHPTLQPLAEAGLLDYAVFDASHPTEVQLVNSGTTLRPGTLANPMLVTANYLFDSIPQDCFSVRDGQLFENLVRVTSPHPVTALDRSQPMRDLSISFDAEPADATYYPERAINRILDGYRQRLDGVTLLFPIAGIRCLEFFRQLSGNRALLIAADIGRARESDVGDQAAGGIGEGNNFWLEVNFHALGEYIREMGGSVLHPPNRHATLNVSAFILGESSSGFAETALAYDDAIGDAGPDDFFLNTRGLSSEVEGMGRSQLLAFLRSTAYDPDYVLRCMPLLLETLTEASWAGKEDLRRLATESWEAYYPMGDSSDVRDLASGLGVLLYTIGDYAEALDYFHRSLQLVAVDPRTMFNVALCLNRLDRPTEAIEWLDKMLELEPDNTNAREMRADLQASAS